MSLRILAPSPLDISMGLRMLFRFSTLVVALAIILQIQPSIAQLREIPTACFDKCLARHNSCLARLCNGDYITPGCTRKPVCDSDYFQYKSVCLGNT